MKLVSVVLMAGFSSRMGQPKQHVILEGKSFLEHITNKLEACSDNISEMLFVGQDKDEKGKTFVKSHNGRFIVNPKPEDGPLSSIRLAVESLDKDTAILLWPTDHPMVSLDTVKKLIEAWEQSPELITLPSDGQRRGHPSIFPPWCLKYFNEIALDQGAKAIMQLFPDRINHVLVDDPYISRNFNTPESLHLRK